MKFFFQAWQRVYMVKTAKHRPTFFNSFIDIYRSVFAAMLYVFTEPARIIKEYRTNKSWRTILNPRYDRITIGKIIVTIIAIPCSVLIVAIFTFAYILFTPFIIILFLLAYFFNI